MALEALGGNHPRRFVDHGPSDELVGKRSSALKACAVAFAPHPTAAWSRPRLRTARGRYDEPDDAVTDAICKLIHSARSLGLRTSICGQAPSVHEAYAELLVRAGIDAISVSIDPFERTCELVGRAERRVLLDLGLR